MSFSGVSSHFLGFSLLILEGESLILVESCDVCVCCVCLCCVVLCCVVLCVMCVHVVSGMCVFVYGYM